VAIDEGSATPVGRLERCWYCPDCFAHFRDYSAAEAKALAEFTQQYETFRAENLSALKEKLRKVPDA
jgi:hypothetical protein